MKSAFVVTYHQHYMSGDAIAVFETEQSAVKYVEDLIKNYKYEKILRDDGVIDYDMVTESYEIKHFEVKK